MKTIHLAKKLFRCGFVDTLQATIVIPYPGTPLFEECRRNGWLKTEDWDRYDMREAVMAWEGEKESEVGRDRATGKHLITIDPIYYRPTEVDILKGNPAKAKAKLGWAPKVKFDELARLMVRADMEKVKKRGY